MSDSSSSSTSIIDQKFMDMESIKSYSNTDEYLFAMREDLAERFNSMYSIDLNAETFIESMENGVLICKHAKQIMKAANDDNQQNIIY
jgi:growth arrest-specific protein 2